MTYNGPSDVACARYAHDYDRSPAERSYRRHNALRMREIAKDPELYDAECFSGYRLTAWDLW